MESSVRNPLRKTSGFTLVELLIVVVLLGILAMIALPSAAADRSEAVKSSLKANVQGVGMLLEYRRQETDDGSFPATIDGSWFSSGSMPGHPDQMAGVPLLETVSRVGVTHPSNKIIASGGTGAYWYNVTTGSFRARVRQLETSSETLAYYNQVNGSGAADLASTVDTTVIAGGGGSGGSGGGSDDPAPIEVGPGPVSAEGAAVAPSGRGR